MPSSIYIHLLREANGFAKNKHSHPLNITKTGWLLSDYHLKIFKTSAIHEPNTPLKRYIKSENVGKKSTFRGGNQVLRFLRPIPTQEDKVLGKEDSDMEPSPFFTQGAQDGPSFTKKKLSNQNLLKRRPWRTWRVLLARVSNLEVSRSALQNLWFSNFLWQAPKKKEVEVEILGSWRMHTFQQQANIVRT